MLRTGSVQSRVKPTVLAVAVLAASALSFAGGAGADPHGPDDAVAPIGDGARPCCAQALPGPAPDAPAPEALAQPAPEGQAEPALEAPAEPAPEAPADPAQESLPEPAPDALPESAEAVTVVHLGGRLLAAGVCNERGLQVKTIEVERAVSAKFPQIHSMIGVRPDAKPWHPNGLAVDIMIPNSGSAEGIALGNAIRDYALSHVQEFAIQDVIWRGTYYTPSGPSGSGYGHYDHVHITTHGGGYPSGHEEYVAP